MAEVKNGILGVKRDILIRLIDLMIFRKNSLIRNLIGVSGESVCWINHVHFTVARTLCERHLERHIIPSKKERGKKIIIKFRNIIFKLGYRVGRSILINILIRRTILECTIKISKNVESCFYVGVCTPKQVNDVVVQCLGWNKDCGGSFRFHSWDSYVLCSGNYSRFLKEGGIKKEEEITAIVNNKNMNNKGGKRKMNIIRNQKRVPHTIINIPKDGVHLGFSFHGRSNTLSIISLSHVNVLPPPFNDGKRCIVYDFDGGFENDSFIHQDEDGKKVLNIREYYKF